MKKAVLILSTFLIILSGMHISLAKHICGGEIADVSISVAGESAGCGMDDHEDGINNKCCENDFYSVSVDKNYSLTFLNSKIISEKISQIIFVTHSFWNFRQLNTSLFSTNVSPPDLKIASNVFLADICVFRI